jgi:hypothetical protein
MGFCFGETLFTGPLAIVVKLEWSTIGRGAGVGAGGVGVGASRFISWTAGFKAGVWLAGVGVDVLGT